MSIPPAARDLLVIRLTNGKAGGQLLHRVTSDDRARELANDARRAVPRMPVVVAKVWLVVDGEGEAVKT